MFALLHWIMNASYSFINPFVFNILLLFFYCLFQLCFGEQIWVQTVEVASYTGPQTVMLMKWLGVHREKGRPTL